MSVCEREGEGLWEWIRDAGGGWIRVLWLFRNIACLCLCIVYQTPSQVVVVVVISFGLPDDYILRNIPIPSHPLIRIVPLTQ